jgi:hypothetical protein
LVQELPMNKLIRLTSGFLCLGLLALGITVSQLACPSWWDGDNRPSLAEELGHEERLNQLQDASRRRLEAKGRVAEEVIARRRSLAEAIEQFRACDQEWPPCRPWPRSKTAEELGMSEDEWDGRLERFRG